MPGAAAGRSKHTSKELRLCGRQKGLEEHLGRVPYKIAAAPICFMAPVHVSVENAQ